MCSAFAVSLVAVTSVNAAFFDDNCCPPADCPCPPSRPFLDPCGNWYFNAEGLYWEASEEGLSYGTKQSIGRDSSFDSGFVSGFDSGCGCSSSYGCDTVLHNKVKNIGSSWDGGFRIGLGYDLPCDGWDVVTNWTWFRTSVSKSNDCSCDGDRMIPAWGDGLELFADRISADWSLNLNVLDVELGREFCVSPCLSLRPFMGIRAAWIDQKYNINQEFASSIDLIDNEELSLRNSQDIQMKSKFSGVGVRGGLGSEWKVGCGLSIYGDVAASLLWGQFNRDTKARHDGLVALDGPINDVLLDVDRCEYQKDSHSNSSCRAITDVALGLRWKQFFDCDRIAVTFQLGWEHHCFFDQNRFENIATVLRPNPQQQRGDLYTQGVTFGGKIDF